MIIVKVPCTPYLCKLKKLHVYAKDAPPRHGLITLRTSNTILYYYYYTYIIHTYTYLLLLLLLLLRTWKDPHLLSCLDTNVEREIVRVGQTTTPPPHHSEPVGQRLSSLDTGYLPRQTRLPSTHHIHLCTWIFAFRAN